MLWGTAEHIPAALNEAPPNPPPATVRPATPADAAAAAAIFNHYVRTSAAIWVDDEVDPAAWADAWARRDLGRHPVIVAESGGNVVGYGALGPYSPRNGYARTVENSVYVHPAHVGRGVGGRLLDDLLARAVAADHHLVVALIDAEQPASFALHERRGFAHAGRLREAGFKFGRWRDVVFLQKLL